jgi:hypothetical protein
VRAARKYDNRAVIHLWQPECHPIELSTATIADHKLHYMHYNPVEAGYVRAPEDWLYSSAVDYNGGKGLIDIIHIDPLQPII